MEKVKLKNYKLKLNSADKIEELLQELYNEACKNIVEIQTQMNKIVNSVNLNEEIMEAKTKYAKAINDFIVNKDKAIGRKLEIAKLMTEIMKYNGDASKAFNEGNRMAFDIDALKDQLLEETDNNKKIEYTL